MTKEQRALIRHLFSEITAKLEIAESLAIEGQRSDLKSQHARDIAQKMLSSIDEAACLAAAVGALSARAGYPTDIRGTQSRASRTRRRISRNV